MTDDMTRGTHTITADWIGDIGALAGHVEEALDHQLGLASERTTLTTAIRRFHTTVRGDRQRVVTYQARYGSAALPAIGPNAQMRHDNVIAALRDDELAFDRVATAYAMLHATAMLCNDSATEAFAGDGLKTWARMVRDINRVNSEAMALDLAGNADDSAPSTDLTDTYSAFIIGA